MNLCIQDNPQKKAICILCIIDFIFGVINMNRLKVGDIVVRDSYKRDLIFKVVGFNNEKGVRNCVLRGLMHRLEADSVEEDLIKVSFLNAFINRIYMRYNISRYEPRQLRSFYWSWIRRKPGRILHIDASEEYLVDSLRFYKRAGLRPTGYLAPASSQPRLIKRLLRDNRPDIIAITGHDGLKKDADKYDMNSYRNSRYYAESVKQARQYEPDKEKLCIFAGACQSYYEAMMEEGANFASSPGRVLINLYDPAIVCKKVALTSNRSFVTPAQIARITVSGSAGIGGIDTRGKLTY